MSRASLKLGFTPTPKKNQTIRLARTRSGLVWGFTIIEILVAITVFTVGVLGISSFFALSARVTHSAGSTTVASNLAQGLLDSKLMESFDDPDLAISNPLPENYTLVTTSPYYNYQKQIKITHVDPSTLLDSTLATDYKKIEVTVLWQEGSKEKNVKMFTIKTKE